MDIDFIKWMCDKAEGFGVDLYCGKDTIESPDDNWFFLGGRKNKQFKNTYYPLLLQRAIEGVNLDNSKYYIGQSYFGVGVYLLSQELLKLYEVIETQMLLDKAKKSALMYIYEQEVRNDRV